MMLLSRQVFERCTRCKFIRSSRAGFLYCKLGKVPENCSRMKRRAFGSRKPSRKKIGREVVLRGDEEVD